MIGHVYQRDAAGWVVNCSPKFPRRMAAWTSIIFAKNDMCAVES